MHMVQKQHIVGLSAVAGLLLSVIAKLLVLWLQLIVMSDL